MKRLLVLAAVLLIAAGAQAQTLRGQARPDAAPGASGAAARPATPPVNPDAVVLPPAAPVAAPLDALLVQQDRILAQCSAACDRDYYMCLAGSDADLCPGSWSQCRVNCSIAVRKGAP